MICPRCKELGLKSKIYDSGSTTVMCCPAYYDEDGKYHVHDTNMSTTTMSCSNGHRLMVTLGRSCPNCDWGNKGKVVAQEYEPSASFDGSSSGGVLTINGFFPHDWKTVGEYELEDE